MGKHCWMGSVAYAEERFGADSLELSAELANPRTCMLPLGHAGPHDFIPDDEIYLSLPRPEARKE